MLRSPWAGREPKAPAGARRGGLLGAGPGCYEPGHVLASLADLGSPLPHPLALHERFAIPADSGGGHAQWPRRLPLTAPLGQGAHEEWAAAGGTRGGPAPRGLPPTAPPWQGAREVWAAAEDPDTDRAGPMRQSTAAGGVRRSRFAAGSSSDSSCELSAESVPVAGTAAWPDGAGTDSHPQDPHVPPRGPASTERDRRKGRFARYERKMIEKSSSVEEPGRITTMMVSNLPSRLQPLELIGKLEVSGFEGQFDFCYTPADFTSGKIIGHAFINFRDAGAAVRFKEAWNGSTQFPAHADNQTLRVVPAHVQGRKNNKKLAESKKNVRNPKFKRFVFTGNLDATPDQL